MAEPVFLNLADVLTIHIDQIQRFGGGNGVRDFGFLESALAMPGASFSGEWLHRDIYEMAAMRWLRPMASTSAATILSLTATNAPVWPVP
jgi:hypothetical protein